MKYGLHPVFPIARRKATVVSITRRLKEFFSGKNRATDDGDPREVLDSSYERQLDMLTKVRRGVADVSTSRRRLELQLTKLQQSADHLQEQAVEAVESGRDDLAREALTRRAAVADQIEDITLQRDALAVEEARLTTAADRLQAKVEAFRARKESVKANYTAAEAQTKIGEAVTGMSDEMGNIGQAIQRAEDKTVEMQAKAGAIDELIASGVLDDVTAPAGRSGMGALDRTRHSVSVDAELAALKAGRTTPAIADTPERREVTGGTSEPS